MDGFSWALVVVYGAAQDNKKPEFLADLVRICEGETVPMLVGGILISLEDKRRRIIIILMLDGLLSLMR